MGTVYYFYQPLHYDDKWISCFNYSRTIGSLANIQSFKDWNIPIGRLIALNNFHVVFVIVQEVQLEHARTRTSRTFEDSTWKETPQIVCSHRISQPKTVFLGPIVTFQLLFLCSKQANLMDLTAFSFIAIFWQMTWNTGSSAIQYSELN